MPYEILSWQFLEFLEFSPEPRGRLLIHPRFGHEKADHDHLSRSQSDGPAKETGVAFVEYINDAVIIYVFSPFADLASARRACGDLFGNGLVTIWAEFQGLFSGNRILGTSGHGLSCEARRTEPPHSICTFCCRLGSDDGMDSLQGSDVR